MEEYIELQEKILSTLERLEKSGTLDRFTNNIPEKQLGFEDYMPPTITSDYGYSQLKSSCANLASNLLYEAECKMALAKAYANYPTQLYNSYNNEYRKYIQNPDILKFLQDYEADHKGEGNA